jgi:hypothetical protein
MSLHELRPANALLDRPRELRDRFEEDGFLFFRGLLPADEILPVRRGILSCCRGAGWLSDDGADALEGRADPSKACVEPEPAFLAVYREVQKLERFHALAHHRALLDVVEAVLGEPALPHPNKIARLSFPHNVRHTTPPHQDFPFIQGTAETFTTWIPLGDIPRSLGGLMVDAGTHRAGLYEYHLSLGAGGMGIDPASLPDRWHTADYLIGDVLMFHSHLVHRALPNSTADRLRLSVDFRYQARSQPIAESNLIPHTGQVSWEEVYRDWESVELKFYWMKADLTISRFDSTYFENRDREAFELAEQGNAIARPALLRIAQRDPVEAKRERARRALALLPDAWPEGGAR